MFRADVAELVDALVSGTSELNTRGGSSPLVRTRICNSYEKFHDLLPWNYLFRLFMKHDAARLWQTLNARIQ